MEKRDISDKAPDAIFLRHYPAGEHWKFGIGADLIGYDKRNCPNIWVSVEGGSTPNVGSQESGNKKLQIARSPAAVSID